MGVADLLSPSKGFNWVDVALLAAVLVSILVGVWRGLVFEVLSLAGWVAAFVAAQLWGEEVAAWLPVGTAGGALNHGVGIAATFLGAVILWGIASRLVRMLVRATPLSGVDRVLGSVFGLGRAAVLGLLVATVVLMTPAARSADWQRSYAGPWLTHCIMGMKPMLPADVAKHLPSSTR
jgi:membrane protein required for colicin V production